jgi:large subunit ribosomal protein L16
MLFSPKKFKYKKHQKGTLPNKLQVLENLSQQTKTVKLVATSFGSINSTQLVAIRFLIKKFIKKRGLVFFNLFPHRSVSKKPAEIRMGKGKGNFSHWVADVKRGTILCEIFFKLKYKRRVIKVLKRSQIRLPLSTKIKR